MNKIFLFVIIILFANISTVLACPYLQCSNFTDSTKKNDCRYVTSQGLDNRTQQDILCSLWTESYNFDSWHPSNNQISPPDFSTQVNQIDNSRFILAGKIVVFLFFNYFIFSLTKLSFIRKWLIVGS